MLDTYRLDPTVEEYQLCVDTTFPHLFKLYLEKGNVKDKVFVRLGYPLDKAVDGSIVRIISFVLFYNNLMCWDILFIRPEHKNSKVEFSNGIYFSLYIYIIHSLLNI